MGLQDLGFGLSNDGNENPSLSNMGEGFINWGYIVGKRNSMLHMKGLTFTMPRLLDYLRYIPRLSRAQVFSSIFQVPLVHPWTTMDAYGIVLRLKMGG